MINKLDIEDIENIFENHEKLNYVSIEDLKPYRSVSTNLISSIVSRDEIISHIALVKKEDLKNLNVISISNLNSPDKKFSEEHKDLFNDFIELEFNDYYDFDSKLEELTFIQNVQKEIIEKKLLDFIDKNKDKKFVINCSYGISRSPSIGMLLEMYLNGYTDKLEYLKNCKIMPCDRYSPNKTIFSFINLDKQANNFEELFESEKYRNEISDLYKSIFKKREEDYWKSLEK